MRRAAPAFALAAAAAIAVWLVRPSPGPEAARTSRAPADIVTGWALGGAAIDPSELLWSEGDDHEHR